MGKKRIEIDLYPSYLYEEGDIYCPGCGHQGNCWAGGDDYYLGETYICLNCATSFNVAMSDAPELADAVRKVLRG